MMASSSADEFPPLPGKFLVIGGNRGVGLEIVRHLKKRKSDVLATTRETNDDLEVTTHKKNYWLRPGCRRVGRSASPSERRKVVPRLSGTAS